MQKTAPYQGIPGQQTGSADTRPFR